MNREKKMKLTVLVDNNTYIDQYFLGEPALSFYIEEGGQKILFDTGYSDVLIHNAKKLGIDLNQLDTIVLSHGHNDHTGGLAYLVNQMSLQNTKLVAHPQCFNQKQDEGEVIGSPLSREQLDQFCQLSLTSQPTWLSEKLLFLGEIPRRFDFEGQQPIGMRCENDQWVADAVLDDSALVYQSETGLYIITGCSHSGICNIIEYAKEICQDHRINGVIGGFHLFELDEQLFKTLAYFAENRVKSLYPCHCVSFAVKAKINEKIPVREVGVGLSLIW